MYNDDKPVTKAEARAWIKRTREGLRDLEAALASEDAEDLHAALGEVTGATCTLQSDVDQRGARWLVAR